jgi:hypothetical protein
VGDTFRLDATAPVFLVDDVGATMKWYATVLGFTPDPFPPVPPHAFCILRRDGVEIMLQQLAGYRKPEPNPSRPGGVWDVYVRMAGVAELAGELTARTDVAILEPLHAQPYGQRELVVRDPNGYVLVFAEEA